MKECNTIGERIRNLREAKGITQQQLAKALYTSRVNVNYWENDERNIKSDTIIALAKFFDVSCDYLLTGISSKNANISKDLGLKDDAIDNLITCKSNLKNIADLFIGSDMFPYLMSRVYEYITQCGTYKIEQKNDIIISNALDAGYKAICHTTLDNLLTTFSKGDVK